MSIELAKVSRQQVIEEARSWLDTPWSHNQGLKSKGCDCVNFPYLVYKYLGFELPPLPNYHRSPRKEKLLNLLDEYAKIIGVVEYKFAWSDRYSPHAMPQEELLKLIKHADIMVYSRTIGGPPGHLAIRTDYGKIETLMKQGVRETSLGSEFKLLAGYRILNRDEKLE